MTRYVANHSPDLVTNSTFSRDADRFFKAHGGVAHHMKVGNIEVVILLGVDLWAAVVKESLIYTRDEFHEEGHYQRFRADRLVQLDRIEFALAETHPLADKLRRAIRAERNMK